MAHKKFKCACGTTTTVTGKDAAKVVKKPVTNKLKLNKRRK